MVGTRHWKRVITKCKDEKRDTETDSMRTKFVKQNLT